MVTKTVTQDELQQALSKIEQAQRDFQTLQGELAIRASVNDVVRTQIERLEAGQPKNALRLKPRDGHHHMEPVRVQDSGTDRGFGYKINFRHGLQATRGAWPNNRTFTVDAAGGICYDFLVDADYTGTEGQSIPTLIGGTVRLYSILQGAIDQAEADAVTRTILLCGTVSENVEWNPGGGNNYAGSLYIYGVGGLGAAGVVPTPSTIAGTFLHEGRQNAGFWLVLENLKITGKFTASSVLGHRTRATRVDFAGDVQMDASEVDFLDCEMVDLILHAAACDDQRYINCFCNNIDGDNASTGSDNFEWIGGQMTGSITVRDAQNWRVKTHWLGTGLTQNWYVNILGEDVDPDNIRIEGHMEALNAASAVKDYVLFDDSNATRTAFNVVVDLICEKPTSTANEVHYFRNNMSNGIRTANIRIDCGVDASGTRLEDMAGGFASVKGPFKQSTFMLTPCSAEIETTTGSADNCIISGTPANGSVGIIADPVRDAEFFNGTFVETLDADISEAGGVVTLSLQQEGTGDLTMKFSDGLTTLDCTPAVTIALTVGSDTSPQANYIYVLKSTKVLTKSTTQWPAAEHIKVAYYLIPSATFVSNNGPYIQQQWNDHRMGTDSQGHLSHMAERERLTAARYFSGIDPNGTTSYLTIAGATVDYKATAGVIFQMHEHASPAVDTSGGDVVLVVNWNGDAYHDITNLFDIVDDSGGNTIGNNKWFNLVIWGVANKAGSYEPAMINLPSGFYNTQASAEQDISAFDNFDLPREFDLDSSTAFLIARLTIQKQAGTWAFGSVVDLRRGDLLGARGGASSSETEFPDNTFNIFDATDNTKVGTFQLDQVTPGNTRELTWPDADGRIALGDHLNVGTPTELTMSAPGAITVTQTYHTVDTFGDAASDTLAAIAGGTDGDLLILRPENDARTVIVSSSGGGAGGFGIFLRDGLQYTMDDIEDALALLYDAAIDSGAGGWMELARGMSAHSLLDGIIHPDTTAAVVTRGSLIKGNSGPKWAEFPVGAEEEILRVTAAADLEYVTDQNQFHITIENPTASEDIKLDFFQAAVTFQELLATVVGSNSPSVTINPKHSTDRSAAGDALLSSPTAITSETTGQNLTSFNDATLVADSHLWLETTLKSGTVKALELTGRYTYD